MKWGVRKKVYTSHKRPGKKKVSTTRSSTAKKVAIGIAIAGGISLAVYGGYKVSKLYGGRRTKKILSSGINSATKMGFLPKPTINPGRLSSKSSINLRISKPLERRPSSTSILTLDPGITSTGEDYLAKILRNQQEMNNIAEQVKDMESVYGTLDELTYLLLNKH